MGNVAGIMKIPKNAACSGILPQDKVVSIVNALKAEGKITIHRPCI